MSSRIAEDASGYQEVNGKGHKNRSQRCSDGISVIRRVVPRAKQRIRQPAVDEREGETTQTNGPGCEGRKSQQVEEGVLGSSCRAAARGNLETCHPLVVSGQYFIYFLLGPSPRRQNSNNRLLGRTTFLCTRNEFIDL